MSLPPPQLYSVPEQTRRVARAAFPKGNLCLRVYDELGTLFEDQDFADLFPAQGQPALAPFRLALVTVLQFVEGLSDRAAADAVRGRMDWKYLLCLELDDPGFDFSVLCEFRTRLVEHGAERRLFERLLTRLQDRQLVKTRGRQRTDSTHVLACVRDLNRLERVIETMRAALNALATAVPDWVRSQVPASWVERYGLRSDERRLPATQPEREQWAELVGCDGYALLDALSRPESPFWLRTIPAVETLRQVWIQNYVPMIGKGPRWRQKNELPPSSQRISSPYDPEARYAHKRSTTWVGYKVHLTETFGTEGLPHLITNVHTTEATRNDNRTLPLIQQELSEAELLPSQQLVDGGYIEASQLLDSQRQHGIQLIGPVQSNGRWQQEQATGFTIGHFRIDWEQNRAICPEGKASSSGKAGSDGRGNEVITVGFARADCRLCPSRAKCTQAKGQRRTLNLRPQELHETLQRARQHQRTEEFRAEYQQRAGIEGTISQGVRAFELRRTRYLGLAKTKLQHFATAAALNLERVADWLAGKRPETTRHSAFVRVMVPRAA
jgi:transposase